MYRKKKYESTIAHAPKSQLAIMTSSTTSVPTTGVGRGRGLLGKLILRINNDSAEKKMQKNETKNMDAIISDIHASLCAIPESLVEARDEVSSKSIGNGSTLMRVNKGIEGEDCDPDSSSSTSVARDAVALDKGCMPISYIGGKSETTSVLTTPGQQEMIVNGDSNIHNASIFDGVRASNIATPRPDPDRNISPESTDGEAEAAAHIKAAAEALAKAAEVGRVVLRNGGTYAAADAAATHVALLYFQDAIRPSSDKGVARTMAVGDGAGPRHASMTHISTNIATTSIPTTDGGRGRGLLAKLGLRGQGGNRRGTAGGRMKNENAEENVHKSETKIMDAKICGIHASLCATPESLVEARRVLSSKRTGNSTLMRGNGGEDCDLDSSRKSPSLTSIARDEVANKQGYMPISFISEKSETASVLTTPGQQGMIVNRDSNLHNASIFDMVFQCLASLVDAVDESIGDKTLPFHELCCLSSVSDISTKSSIKSSICSKDSGELERGIDCNPNWRDTVVDTAVTTARAVNTNAGQYEMQQQQQIIYVPLQDYHPHPGAAPHPINGHFHPLSRSMSQITEDSLRSSQTDEKKTNSSHEYYRNSVDNVDEWQCPINAPNRAVSEGEQQHHHSHVPVSREPYSIVLKINTNLSGNTMDESVDRYMPAWTVE